MDTIQYYECIGTTPDVERCADIVREIDSEACKNFYKLEDLNNHIDKLFEKYNNEFSFRNASVWRCDNFGKKDVFSYWAIRYEHDGHTYIAMCARVDFRTIIIN